MIFFLILFESHPARQRAKWNLMNDRVSPDVVAGPQAENARLLGPKGYIARPGSPARRRPKSCA